MVKEKPQLTRICLVWLLLFTVCTGMLYAGARAKKVDLSDFVVKDLQVIDIDNDDGSGLELRWRPLPNEARIISYRIYRGVTPDSLFYIGELPINPKVGVSSEWMLFFDKDYNNFIDIASPLRLRREKGQAKDSPIFRAIPRNLEVIGPMLSKFNLLAVIPKEQFYFKTKPVERDSTIYAGMKTQQFPIYKKLKPGEEYYYTVIAVNEQRYFYPHAEPVKGIPIDNAPEKPSQIFPVYVEDTDKLHFEWEQPVYREDIRSFSIYAIKDTTLYNQWRENPEGRIPANLFWQTPPPRPYTPTTFAIFDLKREEDTFEGYRFFHQDSLRATGNKLSGEVVDYYYALAYEDDSRFSSYGDASPVKTINSHLIPEIPPISIVDRPNDKGDYMYMMWGKPFAKITSVTYLNEARTKMQMSYEFAENTANKINNIYFEIADSAGNTKQINEFFLDNVFNLSMPIAADSLFVKMTFRIKGQKRDETHYLTQSLLYDDSIKSLRPQSLFYEGFCIDSLNFQLLKRTRSSDTFRVSRKFPSFDRESIDLIPFEASIFKGVDLYDLEKNMLLLDHTTDFVFATDEAVRRTIPTSIYLSEALKSIEEYKTIIKTNQDSLAVLQSLIAIGDDVYEAEIKELERVIAFYSGIVNLPELNYINSYTSDKARMKALRKIRETDKRHFTYQLLLSDGKGTMSIADIALNEEGLPTFWMPISNWFDMTKVPALIASLVFALLVAIFIQVAKRGKDLYIRPIAGIEEIDNAIGRATEMGRPILFCPGLSGISDVATLAGLSILGRVAKKAAEYDTRILVPCRDNIVLPIASAIVKEAHSEAGRPDSYDPNNIFFISEQQFAYVAGVNGVMVREKTATNFYMGMFYAEALIMTETGNTTGAIQIAGTDAVTQIPFFITTCDYTLLGEELYAASAYMGRQPLMLGTLKAQDYAKFIILTFLIVGTIMSSLQFTQIIDAFPSK